jgi:hypothetical protein
MRHQNGPDYPVPSPVSKSPFPSSMPQPLFRRSIDNDFAFALPGGAKESYFELKFPLIAARLADLAPLWGME